MNSCEGVVQGIGAALFEECRYDDQAQLLSGTLADYLVPMAAEMPDIVVGHVETPVPGTLLGGKGVGEASIVGPRPRWPMRSTMRSHPMGLSSSSFHLRRSVCCGRWRRPPTDLLRRPAPLSDLGIS